MKKSVSWKKRLIAFATAGLMLIAATGCGGRKDAAIEEDPNTVPENPYEINWYIPGTALKDVASVENEINMYLKDKINATVKINRLETAQYKEKLSNMIQAGEYFDMCFTANWMLDYLVNAENGAFVAYDDLLEKYMPKTYEASDKLCLECVRVNGKIYGLPVIKESANAYGWIYRRDLAEKYNIDMTQIKNYEDLEPVAKLIKENEPDIKYPVDWSSDSAPCALAFNPVYTVQGLNVGYVTGDPDYKVVNRLDIPETMEEFKLAHKYYEEGLVKEDILTNSSDTTQRLKNGQTFCALMPLKPGKVDEMMKNTNYEFAQAYITEAKKGMRIGMSSMTSISATSKNPARVARFIELLNTDPYLNNLVIYGIEGRHYEKTADNVVRVLPDGGYTMAGNQWMIANVYIGYTTVEEDPEKNIKLKEFDDNALVHPLTGFSFVTDNVQAELAACQAVEKQYEGQVALGALDPEPIVEEYKKALQNAGIDKVIEEMQKQLDEFRAKAK